MFYLSLRHSSFIAFAVLIFAAFASPAHALTTITTCAELQAMNDDLTEDYVLGNDIDCTGHDPDGDGSGLNPVGDFLNQFTGTFDGAGYTISGLTIDRSATDYVGLFASLNGATVENVTFASPNITGEDRVGVVAGYALGASTVQNITIDTPAISGATYVGGIFGHSPSGTSTFTDLHLISVDIDATGSYVGGVAGYVGSNTATSTMSNVAVTGSIASTDGMFHGGIVGIIHDGAVGQRLWFSGDLTGGDRVGGITGQTNAGYDALEDVFVRGTVTGDSYVGGIVGWQFGLAAERGYSTADVTGSSNTGGTTGSGNSCTDIFLDTDEASLTSGDCHTGKTTEEMLNVATYTDTETDGLTNAWDFVDNPNDDAADDNYWNISTTLNNGYPYLVGVGESSLAGAGSDSEQSSSTQQAMPTIIDPFISVADLSAVLAGSSFDIDWQAGGFGAGFVDVYFSDDAGDTYTLTDSKIRYDIGRTTVLAPSLAATARVKVVLTDLVELLASAESNSFSIIAPEVPEEIGAVEKTEVEEVVEESNIEVVQELLPEGIEAGDVVKTDLGPAVYQVFSDGTRRVFADTQTYFTWFDSFSYVKTISVDELASMPLKGIMLPNAGVVLVKIASTSPVYALTDIDGN
jgi:hypothetical protein